MMKQFARRTPDLIVKCSNAEAWATTAKLRNQFVATSMDAMPARVAAASKEYSALKSKVMDRSVTFNEVAIGASRAFELYCFYLAGRFIGSGALNS